LAYIFSLAYQNVYMMPSFVWLCFVDQTFFSLISIMYTSVTVKGWWWTEGSCCGESSLPGLLIKHEACYAQKYLRGLGNLWWMWLTIKGGLH